MDKLPITNQHLTIAQRIIAFVQEQGWDVDSISITRYDDSDHPLIGADPGDAWKGQKMKWSLSLRVAPRDDETVSITKKTETA